MSEEKKAHFDEAMNYRKAVDDYMTALYQDIQRKVQLKEFDGSYYIKVMPTPDGVYFRWKRKIGTVPGHTPTLKIYRREGSFYADKFSEDGNGILIIDDIQEKGESIDYLPAKDKDYYYTVNYRAFSAAKGLFGESSWDIYHLFRFNIRLPSQQSAQETDLAKRIREREAHLDKLKVDKHFDLEETKTFINASLRKGETLDDLQASEIERIKAKYAGKPENIEADIKRINAIFNKIRLS